MASSLVEARSALGFFKELVDAALAHQPMHAADETSYYIVNLLAGFLRRTGGDETPLALRLAHALEGGGPEQRSTLREVGDRSLFVSGFFPDSLRRRSADIDLYVAVGGTAYQALSRVETDALSHVFGELAEKFVGFVDVLSEVSERTSCSSNTDLLRLYERWLKTRSRRTGHILVERGLVLAPGSSVVQ